MTDLAELDRIIGHNRRTDATFDYVGYLLDEKVEWDVLIKTIRSIEGVSIYDAERIALRDERWRAWTARQISLDSRCAKRARYHILHNKSRSLLAFEDDRVTFDLLNIL